MKIAYLFLLSLAGLMRPLRYRVRTGKTVVSLLLLISFYAAGMRAAGPESAAGVPLSSDSLVTPEYDVETIGSSDNDENAGVSPRKFRWGPIVSVDLFCPQKATDTSSRKISEIGWGGSLGAMARYEWRRRWFVETGLQLAYGYSPIKVRLEQGERYYAGDYSYDMQRGAVQLPIHAGYRFRLVDNMGISLSVGTMLSFGFAGKIDYDGPEPLPEFSLYGSDGVWNRFGTDFVFGVHFDTGRVTVGVTGNMGLTQMARRDIFTTRTVNENECRIDLMYWFGAD